MTLIHNAYDDDSIVLCSATARVRSRALAQSVLGASWLEATAVTGEVHDGLASLAGLGDALRVGELDGNRCGCRLLSRGTPDIRALCEAWCDALGHHIASETPRG